MQKHAKILLIALLLPCLCGVAIAEDYQHTYSLDGLLSYTVYDPGYISISENKKLHHYYPSNGGVMAVQYSDMPSGFSKIYSKSVLYETVFPSIVTGLEANSEMYVFLSDKCFMFANYYAYQISFGFVLDKTNIVRADTYLIATPSHLFSIGFLSSDTQGAISKDNIPFVLASFVFTD